MSADVVYQHISSDRACRLAGVTYRQFDYWIRKGWINAGQDGAGSGFPRYMSTAEAEVLRLMGALIRVGFTTPVAADLARQMDARGVRLGEEFELVRREATS